MRYNKLNDEFIPIFIFSLPRSGSTLVQRLMALHPDIETVSEPWIILPFLYTLKRRGVFSEYSHQSMVNAISDFYQQMPNGVNDYLCELRLFLLRLYKKSSKKSTKYFLDKTPRYSLIVEEIFQLFPHGKFIFLWRNPLSIAASIINTYGKGKWKIPDFKIDMFQGLENLTTTYHKYRKNAISIKYEDVIKEPMDILGGLLDYLSLDRNVIDVSGLKNMKFEGRMGDSVGMKLYQDVSEMPLDKWKHVISNPVRKAWCKKYLNWIGSERLSLMGYNIEDLRTDLDKIPVNNKNVGSDLVRIIFGIFNSTFEIRLLSHKFKNFSSWHKLYGHK